ncbi:MAG: O-acetyl-ADP-ribose deacetylase [Deltaproteobacteria bacterium]|nr:O-acetyl-ADP-ribose deacetylase [Deltaproteobacteria bacterium]
MDVTINNTILSIIRDDITNESVDAIVNAANSRLAGGGGVDGAIHRAGGPKIMEECKKIGGCPTGSAVLTTGGNLKAKYVIHAVGPMYKDGNHSECKLLASAYKKSLEIAKETGLNSIAFPSISTGVYGYPIEDASEIALKTIIDFIRANRGLKIVRCVLFSDKDLEIYKEKLEGLKRCIS